MQQLKQLIRHRLLLVEEGSTPDKMPSLDTVSPQPKLIHLCIFGRARREQSREYSLQRPATQPTILPKRNNLSIPNFPLKTVFKTSSPSFRSPHLLQIFPPKGAPTDISILSQASPTTIFRNKNLFPQSSLIRTQPPNPLSQQGQVKRPKVNDSETPTSRGSHTFFQETQAIFLIFHNKLYLNKTQEPNKN